MNKLVKPTRIANDEKLSAKWDEITSEHTFIQEQSPLVEQLCALSVVFDTCMADIMSVGAQVVYTTEMGDVKALPQIEIMRKMAAEIRAIRKALGINEVVEQEKPKNKNKEVLTLVKQGREARRKAAGG